MSGLPVNGVSAASLGLRWQKAPQSYEVGNCVEVARLPEGGVALRNSRDPEGPALIFTDAEAQAFAAGVSGGAFDHLFGA